MQRITNLWRSGRTGKIAVGCGGLIALLIVCSIFASLGGEGSSTPTATVQAVVKTEATARPELHPTNTVKPTQPPPSSAPGPTDTSEPTSTPGPTDTPRPTRTPVPTPTPELGTSDNPFPYGSTIEVSTGFLGLGPTAHVTAIDIIRGQAAWDLIRRANPFNEAAPEGFEWMLIKMRIENRGGGENTIELGPSDFAMRSGGRLFEYWDVAMDICCLDDVGLEELESAQLFGGAQLEGWIYFPVAIDDTRPLLKLGEIYLSMAP